MIAPPADLPGSLEHPANDIHIIQVDDDAHPDHSGQHSSSLCAEMLQGRLTGHRAFRDSETDHTW